MFAGLGLARACQNSADPRALPLIRVQVQKPKARVLILARDSVIAALIGMLVEMDGYDPAFPAPGETAEQALARLRAPIVVCADCDMPDVQSDLFYARVARAKARVVIFGTPGSEERMKELATRHALQYFVLPTDRATLARVLDAALQENQASPSRRR
jgi:DNA-binding NtrC family response regulator